MPSLTSILGMRIRRTSPPPLSTPAFLLKPDQAIDALRKTYHAGIHTQEELENTRNRLRGLFDAVSDGLFVFHKGDLLLANREAARMLKKANETDLLRSIYEAGMRRGVEHRDSPGAAQSLDGFPHVLVTSCTTLQLQEGRSYLVGVSDLSRALELSKQIEELSTQERQRIARDLHDGLSQLLSSLSFQAKALSVTYKNDPESDKFTSLSDLSQKCLTLGTNVYRDLDQI